MDNYIFELNLTTVKRNRLFNTAEVYKAMFEYTLKKQKKYYKENNTFIVDNEIRKEVTRLKKENQFKELNKINAEIINHAIHSATKYFIHCIKNNSIPLFEKEPMKDFHFYTNASRVKIDFKKNTIHIDKIKTLSFIPNDKLKELENKELKSCKVYLDPKIKNWLISISPK